MDWHFQQHWYIDFVESFRELIPYNLIIFNAILTVRHNHFLGNICDRSRIDTSASVRPIFPQLAQPYSSKFTTFLKI